ncbi:acetate uptake transporter family protein [Streptomyces clavifer]|uniref:hypothetical protein n=1 Tax=Streptomyces clavifer TaxID=68188 RepID=UPI0037F5387A
MRDRHGRCQRRTTGTVAQPGRRACRSFAPQGNALQVAAGWSGIGIGAYALYSGLALLVEDGKQRTVLPLFRRGAARTSIEGGLREQLTAAQQEAGVRHQL